MWPWNQLEYAHLQLFSRLSTQDLCSAHQPYPVHQLRFEQSFSKANLSRSSLALTASCRFLGLAFYSSCLLGHNSRAIIHLCHPCRSYITELVYVTMLLVIRHVILDCSMPTKSILVEKKSCGACIKQVSSVGGRERR